MNPAMPKPLQPDCPAAIFAVTTQEWIYALAPAFHSLTHCPLPEIPVAHPDTRRSSCDRSPSSLNHW